MSVQSRFDAVRLRYGGLSGEWSVPAVDRPVVIAGPNGSGKTTWVSGLIRTLYGFDRRRQEDARELEHRAPWSGEEMTGRVVVERDDERIEVERAFATDRVRVRPTAEGTDRFIGDANPAARNQEATRYRQILGELLGLGELEAYRQTLLIRQGELSETALGEHLLRIAAGGHARVQTARRTITAEHRAVTRRPIDSTASAAINPRELERVDEEIEVARRRLEDVVAARQRRAPLVEERDRTIGRLEDLNQQIDRLERAFAVLARTDATEANSRHLRQQIRRQTEAARGLERAVADLDASRDAQREATVGGRYPDDFPELLARVEVRWRDVEELERVPGPVLGITAVLFLILAVGAIAVGQPVWTAVFGGLGGLAGAGWLALWQWASRRRAKTEREVERLLSRVPAGSSLRPSHGPRALERFRAQQATGERLARARDELADAMREGRRALREADWTDRPEVETMPSRARWLSTRLDRAAESAREQLAVGRVELEQADALSLALPDGVDPAEEAVVAALRQRRRERTEAQEHLQAVRQELLEEGTASESEQALERRLRSLETRRSELVRKAEVLEAAYALIADAYDAFRERDQDRLVDRVSRHVDRLGGSAIGGVDIGDSLDDAGVEIAGRRLPLTTPPLSFGELHAVQLGIRLGAADFLAGAGIAPPLIVDEPFAHLDSERAGAVWQQLVEVAAHRQVLITTQDLRLLAELGVEPDIRLHRSAR